MADNRTSGKSKDKNPKYQSEIRKSQHIELASDSQVKVKDERFHYEPLFSSHLPKKITNFEIVGKRLKAPIWVSSMTGGGVNAATINKNLALACNEFGMGMGLGSCRSIIDDDEHFADFDVRKYIGNEQPLFANIGIAQLEHLQAKNEVGKILKMVERLRADGLIIHINPLQEWLQPEGNLISKPPVETIERFIHQAGVPLIVKEVGQGMGPKSLGYLMQMPLEALEFGAFGGTNFSKLELLRDKNNKTIYKDIPNIGESALDMIGYINELVENKIPLKTNNIIISGGINSFLDGYYFVQQSKVDAIYGHAFEFLKFAIDDYSKLQRFIQEQINGYRLATNYLTIRK